MRGQRGCCQGFKAVAVAETVGVDATDVIVAADVVAKAVDVVAALGNGPL